ncbi:hypothetical protein H845_2880 [Komagataeibacter xylinus E25]|nr:hypothetical protein H845_2880 [Komagataeibacter xylinus E25]
MIDKHDHSMHAGPCVTISCAHDLGLVTAMAASLRVNCTVVSPPGAGCVMGVPWWVALVAACPLPALLDCGQAAGYAACALRAGVHGVITHAPVAQHHALVSLARVTGGHVMTHRPASLDLPPRDAGPVLERYLRAAPAR